MTFHVYMYNNPSDILFFPLTQSFKKKHLHSMTGEETLLRHWMCREVLIVFWNSLFIVAGDKLEPPEPAAAGCLITIPSHALVRVYKQALVRLGIYAYSHTPLYILYSLNKRYNKTG